MLSTTAMRAVERAQDALLGLCLSASAFVFLVIVCWADGVYLMMV